MSTSNSSHTIDLQICNKAQPGNSQDNAQDNAKPYSLVLVAVAILDILSSVTLFYAYQSTSPWHFHTGTADMLLLCAARLLTLAMLGPLAACQSEPATDGDPTDDLEQGVA